MIWKEAKEKVVGLIRICLQSLGEVIETWIKLMSVEKDLRNILNRDWCWILCKR